MAKDDCIVTVYNCTIVDNSWGFTNYSKVNPGSPTGGGHTIAWNNILWDNGVTISMWNAGTLTADHCNFGDTNWPGEGNVNLDPQFVNAALRDYRLGPNSPCRGTGRNGVDMGVRFPVGAPMAASHPSFESIHMSDTEVILRFWADNEKSYNVEAASSLSAPIWTQVTSMPAPALPKLIEISIPLLGATRFYRIAAVPAP